jgi:Cu/Ag efflux pump CusA
MTRLRSASLRATRRTGRPIFFAITITLLGVIPVFVLTGQAGKRFHPLALNLRDGGATLLAVPLVLLLSSLQIGSKIGGEEDNTPRGLFSMHRQSAECAIRIVSRGQRFSRHAFYAMVRDKSLPCQKIRKIVYDGEGGMLPGCC